MDLTLFVPRGGTSLPKRRFMDFKRPGLAVGQCTRICCFVHLRPGGMVQDEMRKGRGMVPDEMRKGGYTKQQRLKSHANAASFSR